jgi:transketolase
MFGMALLDVIKVNDNIRVLSADHASPTGLDKFRSLYPEKFYNLGIAEQNMIGVAAGLASEGYTPICVAQACFISMRSFEQIRQYAGLMKFPLILVGFASGYSLSFMGNTHFAIEDIALMRTIPEMQVIAPCDAMEAVVALQQAISYNRPTYIRLFGGSGTPIVYNEFPDFKIGQSIRLREGSDVNILATGSMVSVALEVADVLDQNEISASVVDMHTIKPLDQSAIDYKAKMIVTVEEHNLIGGLGDAVAGVLCSNKQHPALLKIGVNDNFSEVGEYKWLLDNNGLSSAEISELIISKIE